MLQIIYIYLDFNYTTMSVGGDTLSGAATGASAGAMFGPYGAAIGGVVGAGAGLISGLGKKKKRDEAEALAKNRPQYQIPKEVFQNQAMYEAMSKSSRVPGQAYIENQIGQNQATALNAAQRSAGSSADALAALGGIQANTNNQQNQLAQMGLEYQAANKDKLAQANLEMADYRQQEFDYNKNQPWQINFAKSQKLNDQSIQDNQNMVADAQALGMVGSSLANSKSTKKPSTKPTSGYSFFSGPSPTY